MIRSMKFTEHDFNYAMAFLETKVETPNDLVKIWKVVGHTPFKGCPLEVRRPWYAGLFEETI